MIVILNRVKTTEYAMTLSPDIHVNVRLVTQVNIEFFYKSYIVRLNRFAFSRRSCFDTAI